MQEGYTNINGSGFFGLAGATNGKSSKDRCGLVMSIRQSNGGPMSSCIVGVIVLGK